MRSSASTFLLAFYLLTINFFFLSSSVSAQALRLCFIPETRSIFADRGYTLDGSHMENHSLPKLLNSANFGPSGVVKREIFPIPLVDDPITFNTIEQAGCDAILVGGFGRWDGMTMEGSAIQRSELTAIRNWSMRRLTNLVVVTQSESIAWGYRHVNGNQNPNKPTFQGLTTSIFIGPFGRVTSFNQGGGYQGSLAGGISTVLSKDAANRPTIVLDRPTNDIILGDIDILTDLGGLSQGQTIENLNTNDILFGNLWAYAIKLATPEKPPIVENAQEKPQVISKKTTVVEKPLVVPTKTTLSGYIMDEDSHQGIPATFTFSPGKETINTENSGKYSVEVNPSLTYQFTISSPGYQSQPGTYQAPAASGNYTQDFWLKKQLPIDTSGKFINRGSLNPLNAKPGDIVTLQVMFVQSHPIILKDKEGISELALDRILRLLQSNPQFNIKLTGYTDNVGETGKTHEENAEGKKRNLRLSIQRADTIKDYLIDKGINAKRISTEGLGSANPVADNNNEATRWLNRRVTMTVLH